MVTALIIPMINIVLLLFIVLGTTIIGTVSKTEVTWFLLSKQKKC